RSRRFPETSQYKYPVASSRYSLGQSPEAEYVGPRTEQRNIETVSALWERTHRDGIEAALSTVSADVEWRPFFAPGRSYTSTELAAYLLRLQGGRSLNAWLARVEACGDHVLASGS